MATFSKSIGINVSTLSRILKRTRSPGRDLAETIGRAVGLKKTRLEYFLLLVKMDKEVTDGGRSLVLAELEKLKNNRKKTIDPESYAVFDRWHLLALREYLRISPADPQRDSSRIARLFRPAVTESQVKKGLRTLLGLHLAAEDSSGKIGACDAAVSTGDNWDSLAIHNYQREMALIAVNALDTIPRDDRDFSTLVVGLDAEGFAAARGILKECRERLLELEARSKEQDKAIYHLNMHFFPVCTIKKDDLC